MSKIVKQKTKTLVTKDNGRSSDAVSPNFIYGCLGGCMKSYCYVGRYNHDKVYVNENVEDILISINNWLMKQKWPKQSNQTDSKYYTIDIGCSTDVCLHQKHYDWNKVFRFFNEHPRLKSTFATKYPTRIDLSTCIASPDKNRIRVSLMPQRISDILEPGTDKILDRIAVIPKLMEKFEVQINYSPIVVYRGWKDDYRKLFQQVKAAGINVPCECIFLTYSQSQIDRNSDEINDLCNISSIQEGKTPGYYAKGETVLRYDVNNKPKFIDIFKSIYKDYWQESTIRYIF
jgi:spore photoproduct lyase